MPATAKHLAVDLHTRGPVSEADALRATLRDLEHRLALKQKQIAELTGSAPPGAAPSSDLAQKIAAQGDAVRALKQAKAPKEQIQAEVEKLLALKKLTEAAPAPAPSAASGLEAEIAAQGEKVRSLKASKAPKDEIQREVAVLLNLKKMLAEGGAAPSGATPAEASAAAPRDPRFVLLRSVGEECQEESELAQLLQRTAAKSVRPRCYDGFEPSGRMHIAQGVFKTINVNKCTQAGCTFIFWVADWFALMNDKMGGSLERIRTVGEYLVEVWRAAGMNLEHVEFIWSSDAINAKAREYWTQMLDIARQFTLARIIKCGQIMGRGEQAGNLTSAQILYPLMQCTDIFFLRADICQLGLDQRKVNMLAREYCDAVGPKQRPHKPVILSHHMMAGLKAGQEKMSKSDPESAIFMEDTAADVDRKIAAAHCPRDSEQLKKNPILDYLRSIVFSQEGTTFTAGGRTFKSTAEVEEAFAQGSLKEDDLKRETAAIINRWLQPVRDWFNTDPRAKAILEKVRRFKAEVEAEKQAASKGEAAPSSSAAPATEADRKWADALLGWGSELVCDGSWKRPSQVMTAASAPGATVLVPILPAAHPRLGDALSLGHHLRLLKQQGSRATLLLLDWTAFVLNIAGGDHKAIRTLLDWSARAALAASPDRLDNVDIVWQSDVILQNPDKYWVGVINAGRAHKLEQIRSAFGLSGDVTGEPVGPVIASLMFMQDCISSGCSAVAAPQQFVAVAELAAAHGRAQGAEGVPAVVSFPCGIPCLREGHSADSIASLQGLCPDPLSFPSLLLLEDAPMICNSKVKKAFCPPQTVSGNPVIDMAHFLLELTGQPLQVKRPEQYGGDKMFTAVAEIKADWAEEKLHPGDLKPAVQKALEEVVKGMRERMAADKDCATLEKQAKEVGKKFAPASAAQQQAKGDGGKKKK